MPDAASLFCCDGLCGLDGLKDLSDNKSLPDIIAILVPETGLAAVMGLAADRCDDGGVRTAIGNIGDRSLKT